jgi:hypothetical protein
MSKKSLQTQGKSKQASLGRWNQNNGVNPNPNPKPNLRHPSINDYPK